MHELIYFSKALFEPTNDDIQEMLIQFREFNTAHNITGMLLYDGIHFSQMIEGDKQDITNLYSRIQKDPRHKVLTISSTRPVERRRFTKWAMVYRRIDRPMTIDLPNIDNPDVNRIEHLLAFIEKYYEIEAVG